MQLFLHQPNTTGGQLDICPMRQNQWNKKKMNITSSNGKFCEINAQYYKRYEVGWEHIPQAFEDICARGWYLVSWNQVTGLISIGGVQKTKTVLPTLIFNTKHENKQFRKDSMQGDKSPQTIS